jgi:hypothetical protein
MAVTTTTRLGLNNWGAGTDPFTRAQANADHAALDNLAAIDMQGVFSSRPAAGVRGRYYFATDQARLYRDTGSAWIDVSAHRTPHTFAVGGPIQVPAGDTDYIPGFFVAAPTGMQTVNVAMARHRINSGTSVTVKLQKNGIDVTGFTGISVTTTSTTTDPTDVAVADGDYLQLIVTAVSGSPKNLSFSLFLDYLGG